MRCTLPPRCRIAIAWLALAAAVLLPFAPAHATTKGLNQIVTPDIQPAGQLSLSIQAQNSHIANDLELQVELGVSRQFEVAVFQGFSPSEQFGAAELGLVQNGPYLVSTGFVNWSSQGDAPQPFLEAGYYRGRQKWILGGIRVGSQTQGIFGVAYLTDPRTQVQLDYQTGSGNFSTAGFTYSITPSLSVNPSLYYSNDSPHAAYGYVVLSWTIAVGK